MERVSFVVLFVNNPRDLARVYKDGKYAILSGTWANWYGSSSGESYTLAIIASIEI